MLHLSHKTVRRFILSRNSRNTKQFHLISLVFLLFTVHPVFAGHLLLLNSYRSLALTLFSVLAPSVQLHQRFGIPFLTLFVYPRHFILFGTTRKHTIPSCFSTNQRQTPAPLIHLWLTALYKCIYLLTYLNKGWSIMTSQTWCVFVCVYGPSWLK